MSNQAGFGQHLAQAQQSGAASSVNTLASSMAGMNLDKGGEGDDDDDMPGLEPVEKGDGGAKKGSDDDDDDDEDISDGDTNPEEVKTVMNQTGCSRKKAIKALKDSGGDIINASTSSFVLFLTKTRTSG